MNSPIEIRTAELKDEKDILEICHRTGNTRVAPYLFGLRWCLDYLWHDTDNCFSAVDLETGRVVGYILGTLDSAAQVARFKRLMLPKVKHYWKEMDMRTVFDFGHYLFVRYFDWEIHEVLYQTHPAHLHINLAPEYQRQGIGARLLAAYEGNLREKHVPGYHLSVAADNQAGVGFYRKMNLKLLQRFPKYGKPMVLAFGCKLV